MKGRCSAKDPLKRYSPTRESWRSISAITRRLMLRLDSLNVYYGESHILRNVSFQLDPGQVLCLMGRNGVGKTTTLKAIMGLLKPKAGRVLFEGVDISRETPDRRVRRGLAYVP